MSATATAPAPTPARRALPLPTFGRKWDILLLILLVPAFAAIAHITHMLTIGDWDFFVDWKDRQWWPLLTPMMGIVIPSAAQYTLWRMFGIAGGATAAVALLVLSQWLSSVLSFDAFAYFPLAFVSPATMVPLGIMLDVILLLTGSFVMTSIVGGMLWGMLFQPVNAPLFGGMWQPVVYNGDLNTVADVMGFEYVRSQGPAYLRIVEQGHLRAFLSQISYVTALTAGMVCIGTYWVGNLIGRFVALAPARVFMRTRSPLLKFIHPGPSPDATAASSNGAPATAQRVEG